MNHDLDLKNIMINIKKVKDEKEKLDDEYNANMVRIRENLAKAFRERFSKNK